jgi:hypothetical protein
MKFNQTRTAPFLLTLALAVACAHAQEASQAGSQPAPGRLEKLRQDAQDAVTTITAHLIQRKEQLQTSLADKLTESDKQLTDLKKKTGLAGDRVKSEWTRTLARLREKKSVAAKKLEQLKNGSAEKWQEIKGRAEAAIADLDKALRGASGRSKADDTRGNR